MSCADGRAGLVDREKNSLVRGPRLHARSSANSAAGPARYRHPDDTCVSSPGSNFGIVRSLCASIP